MSLETTTVSDWTRDAAPEAVEDGASGDVAESPQVSQAKLLDGGRECCRTVCNSPAFLVVEDNSVES